MSETELKLSVTQANLEAAYDWLLLQGARPAAGPALKLRNRYFDTPEGALNRERVALRLRETGESVIQTLKTRGHLQAGSLRREEWEWALPEPELDLERLEQTPLAGHEALTHLEHCFDTDFERRVLNLSTRSPSGIDTQIECAIDRGVIRSGKRAVALLEVELELIRGDEQALAAVALAMVREVPALVNVISKAEQGYYLADLHEWPDWDDECVAAWMERLCRTWLTNDATLWPRLVETHGTLEGLAREKGCGACFQNVSSALTRAASLEEAPRPLLSALPGLAELQIQLMTGTAPGG